MGVFFSFYFTHLKCDQISRTAGETRISPSFLEKKNKTKNGGNAPVITDRAAFAHSALSARNSTPSLPYALRYYYYTTVCAVFCVLYLLRVGEKIENKGGNDEKFGYALRENV